MRAACIFIPRFTLATELTSGRAPRRRAVIIGEAADGRKAVLDCSPEAEAQGVRPGMPVREALGLCRDAVFLPPDPVRYHEASEAFLRSLAGISPLVEGGDLGLAYVGVGGLQGHYRDEMALGEALVLAVGDGVGLAASVGIAEGKFPAWAAAAVSAPGEVTAVPLGQERKFLAPLDVSLLPASAETLRRLDLYGLRTMADLAALSLGPVQAQFGGEGKRLWELARGVDREPLRPRQPDEVLSERIGFLAPPVAIEALVVAGRQLLSRLHPRLRQRAARRLRLRAALSDGRSWERAVTFREATADREQMLFILKSVLRATPPPGPVEELVLELSGLTQEVAKQAGLFPEKGRRRRQLVEAVRQLRARFGQSHVYQVVEVEPWSRIPERRLALIDYDP
jgi:nucleotidyltransferase/DNA polymerase involved in DNA repair